MDTAAAYASLDGVAIIGMAGRFPGARSVDELWHNLKAGIESIRFFSDAELLEAGIDPELLKLPNYVRARGALGDAEYFDATFFGHSPGVAAIMDPQHRLFLECAWTALEHAGYDPARFAGRIGVFGGESMNTYLLNNVLPHVRMVASVDSLQASIGNDKDSLTSEVAYKLNLKGPSVTIQTASSTSLVAVHIACQSLLGYECDMALAGGVSIHFPETAGYLYQEGGATSPDGHCRTFDAHSHGFVNGHGAGIVVLKRLEQALADGDTIYAVIKGSAINNDGALKVSYMAPSVDGQAEVVRMAQTLADIDAETISYIEAHGTGTALGDPIEIAALTQAFRSQTTRRQFCAIGSIKTNIGHLDTAAGVAGLIKTALALTHRQIPPSLHFEKPNPQIDFANSPFFVNTLLREWQRNGSPRRAGVSSFGMGGTNAHVVLEEAPELPPTDPSRPWQLLLLSAKTATALEQISANLAIHLQQQPDLNLADLAYTLQVGRQPFSYRRMLVAADCATAAEALRSNDGERVFTAFQEPGERPLVWLFSGQGAQYVDMGRDLYQREPVFRHWVDHCAELLRPHLDLDLRAVLYPELHNSTGALEAVASLRPASSARPSLEQTLLAQPALFVVEYALAQLWLSWGVQPAALVGHSIGEYVAACLAGVFTLEDALSLVAARGRLMQELPGGSMLAVPLSEAELRPLLNTGLDLAAINGPALCVVSGLTAAVDQLEQQLSAQGVQCRRLHTSHAFHSAMMEPIVEPFRELVRSVRLNPPTLPYVSNVSGTWITATEATDPGYWARHLRQPVYFAAGLSMVLREEHALLLEIGPGQTLAMLARQHPARTAAHVVLSSLRHPHERHDDQAFLLGTLGRLWLAGLPIASEKLYAGEQRRRIPLPTYPFERQRYWLEPQPRVVSAQASPELTKRSDVADWFYLPAWKLTLLPELSEQQLREQAGRWLLFSDEQGLGATVAQRLTQLGHAVVVVSMARQFGSSGARAYTLDPGNREHYAALFADLRNRDLLPDTILHLWNVDLPDQAPISAESFAAAQERGFYSLVFLAQVLGATSTKPVHIVAVTTQGQSVAGETALRPEKATLLGPCKTIPQEYPHISCQSIDVAANRPGSSETAQISEWLIAECLARNAGSVVAFHDHRRWQQVFEPIRLKEMASSAVLRERGVYLITGGFGNIGQTLARHLAQQVQARLALLGRRPLPPRADWAQWLAQHPADDAQSRQIRSVQELEALGAEVLVLQADITQRDQLQAALEQIDARFGALHGVIHAAGLVGKSFFRPLQDLDRSVAEQHFQAKVYGLLALEQALEGRTLDFCLLISSLSAVLGGLGFSAYAAANLFMDAFAQRHNRLSAMPWMSINWDAWQLSAAQERGLSAAERNDTFAIFPAEGMAAFTRLLAIHHQPQMIVSTGDLATRIAQWVQFESLRQSDPAVAVPSSGYHPRPALPNPFVAPRNELEQNIAAIWQEALKVQQVGVYDNFFDLGGNSLTGLQVVGRLKERFATQIPMVSLYEGPTVSALARLLDSSQTEQPDYEQQRSRGERRRERQRERRG